MYKGCKLNSPTAKRWNFFLTRLNYRRSRNQLLTAERQSFSTLKTLVGVHKQNRGHFFLEHSDFGARRHAHLGVSLVLHPLRAQAIHLFTPSEHKKHRSWLHAFLFHPPRYPTRTSHYFDPYRGVHQTRTTQPTICTRTKRDSANLYTP